MLHSRSDRRWGGPLDFAVLRRENRRVAVAGEPPTAHRRVLVGIDVLTTTAVAATIGMCMLLSSLLFERPGALLSALDASATVWTALPSSAAGGMAVMNAARRSSASEATGVRMKEWATFLVKHPFTSAPHPLGIIGAEAALIRRLIPLNASRDRSGGTPRPSSSRWRASPVAIPTRSRQLRANSLKFFSNKFLRSRESKCSSPSQVKSPTPGSSEPLRSSASRWSFHSGPSPCLCSCTWPIVRM